MDFNQLRSFIAVAREGSFTKAAEKSYLSQSTISSHIQHLEEELGIPLFIRNTKSVEITSCGKDLYKMAVSILSLRERMLKYSSDEISRPIHIGASTAASAYILPKLLAAYHRVCPESRFTVHQSDSSITVNGIRNKLFDIGIIGMNFADPDYECIPLVSDRMIMITPYNDHFLTFKKKGVQPSEILLSHPVIAREEGSGSRQSTERYLADLGLNEEELHIAARVNDQTAIINLVAEGFGISIVSSFAKKSLEKDGRILIFNLPEDVAERSFYLIYPRGADKYEELRSFIRFSVKNSAHLL